MNQARGVLDRIQRRLASDPHLRVGDRVYEVASKPLARGGMGLVYAVEVKEQRNFRFQVHDRRRRLHEVEETFTKAVLKIPFADRGFARSAIRNERDALERPSHPNVVRLLEVAPIDAGEGASVEGLILERLIPSPAELLCAGSYERRSGTDLACAIEMVANLLKALNTIHYHKRIYLCDIKPLNILLRLGREARSSDPREEYVRRLSNGELQWAFIDLGISVPREAVNSATGSFIGTTEYSPPEAVLDSFLSESRDVYSLVATFTETLTGQKPYLKALLSARERFDEALASAFDEPARRLVRAQRGRFAFEAISDAMRAGDPPYDFKELFAELRERPGLSALPGAARERASNALSDLILEGLHPDPAKRANADRLYRILRGPFEITSRATKSFLDDYFLLRFRQHLLPRASEIIDDQTRQPYHYQRLPNVRFTSFFDLPPARDRSRAQTARRKARDVEQRGDRAPRREESRGAARREQSRDAARRRSPRRPPRDPPGPPQSRPPPPR